MKIDIILKSPDSIDRSIELAAEELVNGDIYSTPETRSDDIKAAYNRLYELVSPWIKHKEYVTINIDTDTGTARVLQDTPATTNPDGLWIRVSDREPEGSEVICWDGEEVSTYYPKTIDASGEVMRRCAMFGITHWMPMPKPPVSSALTGQTGMTEVRWKSLMEDDKIMLTPAEASNGWHFCHEWDGLLVQAGTKEAIGCTCYATTGNKSV